MPDHRSRCRPPGLLGSARVFLALQEVEQSTGAGSATLLASAEAVLSSFLRKHGGPSPLQGTWGMCVQLPRVPPRLSPSEAWRGTSSPAWGTESWVGMLGVGASKRAPVQEGSINQFSCSVMSDSLQSHGLQHARPPCPSPTPGVYSNSCPLSW